jgi:hypothetical protein
MNVISSARAVALIYRTQDRADSENTDLPATAQELPDTLFEKGSRI